MIKIELRDEEVLIKSNGDSLNLTPGEALYLIAELSARMTMKLGILEYPALVGAQAAKVFETYPEIREWLKKMNLREMIDAKDAIDQAGASFAKSAEMIP